MMVQEDVLLELSEHVGMGEINPSLERLPVYGEERKRPLEVPRKDGEEQKALLEVPRKGSKREKSSHTFILRYRIILSCVMKNY